MKKVRYLAGVVGVAPALGLMPAGTAANAATHAVAGKGKEVSLVHLKLAPAVGGCAQPLGAGTTSSAKGLYEEISGTYKGSCISFEYGALDGTHTNLDMRTRFYNHSGVKIGGDHYTSGQYNHNLLQTSWDLKVSANARSACIALVLATNHNSVKYGPICASVTIKEA